MKHPLLLGHRGCRGCGFVENSLAAFEYALSLGCDGFEFDVRQSRDGCNVIWHDPDWNRKQIAFTDHQDLVDCGRNHLATLDEVLAQFGHRAYLDIELKVPGCEESVIAALKSNPPQQGFVITTFYPDILLAVYALDNSLPLGLLAESSDATKAWRDFPVQVFLPRHDLIGSSLIEDVHGASRQIMTWTVNSSRHMRRLAEWGIDGLISDDPQFLYQTFHNR